MDKHKQILKTKKKDNLIYRYRWEFLRRSKPYQKDYDAYTRAKNKSQGKGIAWDHKYGIFSVDYRNSYPGCIKPHGVEDAVVFISQFKPSEVLRVDAWSDQALSESKIDLNNMPYSLDGIKFKKMHGEDIPDLKRMKVLRLVIDIRGPKEQLISKFKGMINFYKLLVKTNLTNDKRKRFDQYDRYLEVYDLKEKGWSWNKLARRFYKGDAERDNLDYATKKVKRDYDRCKKLIDGDYRQIR